MKRLSWLAVLFAFALVVAACGDDDSAEDTTTTAAASGGEETTTTESVDLEQGSDLTFHMVTHSDDGTFWSVVKKGADDAAAALGVNVVWSPSDNTPEKQVQDIDAAIAAGSDGIAISLASPEAVTPAAERVVEAGIPLYTLNSGVNQYRDLGAVTHVGQTEIIAGEGAGLFFNDLGATKVLCARQEQSNVGLEERCEGLGNTFTCEVVSEFVGLDATPTDQVAAMSAILQADPSIDGILGVGPIVAFGAIEAEAQAGVDVFIGGFDLSGDLLNAIQAGDVSFTVDQQQYLQGYLPIVLMFLQATNGNTAGGGLPILTGPGFVTADNVDAVLAGVTAGTR